jgi:hypothetical protein
LPVVFKQFSHPLIFKSFSKSKSKTKQMARDLGGLSGRDLGLYFGGVSGALITVMHKRIAQEAAQN